ncbi:S1C family serine protease [Halorussus marinus]|uniref:S1C family serine protease n=1 Tax=Halorussus marinus TaxID=2505976 RepID=UPI00106E56CF|nr:trypsin-like peptidase domain-containing protein [Halorussus marinus]
MRIPAVLLTVALVGVTPATAVVAGSPSAIGVAADTGTQQTCDFESLYDETIRSVVTIQVRTDGGGGLGSGFVYDESGRIVTNQHVVADAETVEVQFDRGQWRTAEVVGTDAYSDLAVLEVDDVPDYADPLAVESGHPETGQRVAALGSPLGLQGTITDGIVSGTNRSLPAGQEGGPQFTIPNTLQTTAAISPGNSGGPLVDCTGTVVGVNTAGAQGGENIGFAVPSTRVERVVPALIQNGSYTHSFLGISSRDVSPAVAEQAGLNVTSGVLVQQVISGSPADGAIQSGDVVLQVAGQPVASQEDLASALVRYRPGDTISMQILRDGERRTVEVTLGERPAPGETLGD